MKTTKLQLAQWLAEEESDLNGDIRSYFTNDSREITSTSEFIKWLMKKPKGELIEMAYSHSEEGQKFVEDNNLIR